MNKECLNCQNYRPEAPANWKPSYKGGEFTVDSLYKVIGIWPDWNSGWPGRCLLNPVSVPVKSVDVCGQWAVNIRFLNTWDDLWYTRRADNEISQLSEKLKAVQKLSLERYHKLQQIKPTVKIPRKCSTSPQPGESGNNGE